MRKKTSHSIHGIVKIKGNQIVHSAYIEYLLESPSQWFYWNTEPFQNKYIELIEYIEFDYPVWIKYIELLPDREVSYNLHFI